MSFYYWREAMIDREGIEEAIDRVRTGDREAFREIVNRTAVLLRAYVSFYVEDPVLVDDIVQDVFVNTYLDIQSYASGTDFMSWVKTRARFAALSARRRLGREADARKRYTRQLASWLSEEAIKSEEARPLDAKLAALKGCLSQLSDRVRELVTMKYFSGLSLKAVARESGMTTSAVGTALHRARGALAKCVEGAGEP
jgi:RNA polymerase sigma-70 factor (ECF subfamily)